LRQAIEIFWRELTYGFADIQQLVIVVIRVFMAVLLGGLVGINRERAGKPAGLRTHVIVSLGTALVVLGCSAAGMSMEGQSRVIQGIVTGIGFIGAGSILKLNEQREIQGLTTAAGLWMTAAVGIAVGLGALGVAVIGTIVTLIALAIEQSWEARLSGKKPEQDDKLSNEGKK
jgi:putative Mg2+ transporter-C (MgtC) family protein